MARSVTSKDVARLAGVSQPTVSRALRNLPGTSPETRDLVLAAARRLSYVPSDSGRSLATRSTRRVAVVAEQLTNPYYPELVGPIQHHLASAGLRTVLLTDSGGGSRTERVRAEDLADGSYDGAVLTTTMRSSTLPAELTRRRVPHVLVNRVTDTEGSPTCSVDNRSGALAVCDLVAGLGHTRVAMVAGPTSTSTGRRRAEWVRRGLRRHGLPLPRDMVRRGAFDHASGLAAGLSLLRTASPPTAVICGNDVIALGVLSAARELGVRVPEDLTVIGFDDIAMASWPLVELTTVHVDLDLMASTAVRMLLDQVEGAPMPASRTVPVDLRLRATHGPAAAAPRPD